MNYATGHALNAEELFLNFPTKKLKMTAKECEEIIGNRHKEKIAEDVFKACVSMVIEDIINNNVTFELPTRAKKTTLKMKRYDRDEFIECRQNGKFQNVSFLDSNFTAYQMAFQFQNAGVFREKLIYLDSRHRDEITKNTNNGKSYY